MHIHLRNVHIDETHGHVGEDFPFNLESDDPSAEELPTQKLGSLTSSASRPLGRLDRRFLCLLFLAINPGQLRPSCANSKFLLPIQI